MTDASEKKMCFDRVLPRDLHRQLMMRTVGGVARAISPIGKQWLNGSTIKIKLIGGSEGDRSMVEQIAPQWTDHANLTFEFTEDPRAEIRVTFDSADGAWSYVGLDNKSIPLHAATLNLGWVDEGVILHEFGHMIGLSHEHQSPAGGIQWNEAAVIADLSGAPNFWDEATIRHNVLNKYSVNQIHGTDFDRKSIMLYAFPDSWIDNGHGTNANDDLSDLDRLFVASEKMYPGRSQPSDAAQELQVHVPIEAAIEKPEEEDLFQFEVTRAGMYTIETAGQTDVVLSLFGPDSTTTLVDDDDDGGVGRNARLRADLEKGTYFARVTHYFPESTGEYRIGVRAS